uniref:Uncharacterized protein n=1 Tax=Anopheles minimus TaxID=112268 RepID=A0A182VSM7_9DIPT
MLKFFEEATKHISAQKSTTLSKMGLLMGVLLKQEVDMLVLKLIQNLETRFEHLKNNKLVTKAMVLDPRMKKHAFANEPEIFKAVYDEILTELTSIYPVTTSATTVRSTAVTDSIFYDFLTTIDETEERFDVSENATAELREIFKGTSTSIRRRSTSLVEKRSHKLSKALHNSRKNFLCTSVVGTM